MKLRTLIIEDEPIALRGLQDFVSRVEFLEHLGSFSQPLEALELLHSGHVDLLLLDLQLPQINGFDFLRSLAQWPAVIIISAYSEYALEGYPLNVADCLLKPVSFERFLSAANKVRSMAAPVKDHLFVKCDARIEKILLDDILFVKAMENYVIIQTSAKKNTSPA